MHTFITYKHINENILNLLWGIDLNDAKKNLSLLPLIECNFLYLMKSMLYKYTIKIRQIATIQSMISFIYRP